jgi:hypothetical protein
MSSPVRTSLMWLARALPTALVLGGLAALAVWGARNDWKLPPLASRRKAPEEKKDKEDEGPLSPGSVTLSSEQNAANAGSRRRPRGSRPCAARSPPPPYWRSTSASTPTCRLGHPAPPGGPSSRRATE